MQVVQLVRGVTMAMMNRKEQTMEIIIKCSDDVRGGTNIYGEPIRELVRCKECRYKDMEICPMYRLVVAGVRKYDDYCSYGEREGK